MQIRRGSSKWLLLVLVFREKEVLMLSYYVFKIDYGYCCNYGSCCHMGRNLPITLFVSLSIPFNVFICVRVYLLVCSNNSVERWDIAWTCNSLMASSFRQLEFTGLRRNGLAITWLIVIGVRLLSFLLVFFFLFWLLFPLIAVFLGESISYLTLLLAIKI